MMTCPCPSKSMLKGQIITNLIISQIQSLQTICAPSPHQRSIAWLHIVHWHILLRPHFSLGYRAAMYMYALPQFCAVIEPQSF